MGRSEPKVPPVVVLLAVAAGMWAVVRLVPSSVLALPNARLWALLPPAVGLGVALSGVQAFRRHRTTVNPLNSQGVSAMVRTGIYGHSRNPMYLGMALVLVGWALFLDSSAAWLGVPLFVAVLTRCQILPEEGWLRERFGPDYARYCSEVRRWI